MTPFDSLKYVVLQRFGTRYVTFIMILESKDKAEALAKFLNDGHYFETDVTIETVDKNIPNKMAIDLIARTL